MIAEIRNTLARNHGEFWFDNPNLLTKDEQASVRRATKEIHKRRTAGRVVAELNFGFWVGLFSTIHDGDLWRTDLHLVFTPLPERRQLHNQLDRLRTLRNRIAHHEPIFHRDLLTDYQKLMWILEMLSTETAAWTAHHSRLLEVLDTDPAQVARF